ncbi:hypothetical protein CFR78_15715 [Komagataeibacter rhaeticus]|uniref:DUF4258 domain-containing protein n=1 Tax=Komagataeibacter rhaeticus TaxID=215221 RepID=UPI000D8CD5C8|nr:DUF4258 domain-containing protein [Komagataeibacter rhaeticus]PYD52271.1 hypothetical protein CFR78_15715 [Komagataeibacter rhaeticus]GBQ17116.1 hypothetical protein AA16663_2596 [Komagataeibacter rhaeticus DSM 16663]
MREVTTLDGTSKNTYFHDEDLITVPHDAERRRLQNAIAQGARIVWTDHARERSRERHISKLITQRVLRCGNIDQIEAPLDGDETWRVVGTDNDGRRIGVVVTLKEDVCVIRIITVMALR